MSTELLDVASKLKGLPVSQIKPEVLVQVREVVEGAQKMGARVDWFDNVIGKFRRQRIIRKRSIL